MRDMLNLQIKHPDLYNHFAEGFFAIAKTQNPFSLMNASSQSCFTVAGPEVARPITEIVVGIFSFKSSIPKHHDQSTSVQKRLLADTKALILAFERWATHLMKTVMKILC